MATDSPESPSKKRKQPINGLKRDQPLFAGRRPNRSLQQPPDFLTDSLNTSCIPSPSPPKSPTRQNVRAKPRQALGNGRQLTAALRATSSVNDENRPPSSNSSSDRRNAQKPLKPRPAPSTGRAKASSPEKAARSPTHITTPSPPRGRQNPITSPANSESSPGRGYAEAYQRIVEEENLAQEDSIDDMEEIGGYGFNQQDRLQDLDRLRLQRLRQSASPVSLKASRRLSPRGAFDASTVIEAGRNDRENTGHGSDSDSGLDGTEDITDTSVDSGSSQYAKDLQRLGALKSGAKAFSKARIGERVGLSVENLQRRNGSSESLGSAFSAGSLSNRGSDPSINIPKGWGRKAKPGKDWLARINSRSGKFTGDVQKRHSSGDQIIAENQRRDWSEPIDQWIATAADIPLPSSEDRASPTRDSSQGSTPTTAVPLSASVDRRRQWEMNDDDFTGRSLQISESPPIRIRKSALDRIREHEIESLEKRAVTTNRLGELREKSSREGLRRSQSNKSAEEPYKDEEAVPTEASQPKESPSKSAPQSESHEADHVATPEDSLHDEGEPIPDTPVIIHRKDSHEIAALYQRSSKRSEDQGESSSRPMHERKDSHDLLKRLARVTSNSPSPTRQQPAPVQRSSPNNSEAPIEQTPHASKPTSNLKTPVVTGAWVDQTFDKTPQPSMPTVSLKTPLITGAWIDTPLPTGGRGPPMPTPSDLEEHKELATGKIGAADLIHRLSPNNISLRPKLQVQAPLKYSGPPLGNSALEEILNDAKATKGDRLQKVTGDSDSEEEPTLHLGESTIQSLEELIANDEDFSTLLAPTPPSPEISQPSSDPSPASKALTTSTTTTSISSALLTDPPSYTHLLTRLSKLAPSLRASKKQIETIERAVSTVPTNNPLARPQNPCNEGGELHDFLFPCQTCGCPGRLDPDLDSLLKLRNSFTTLTLPIPRLWRWPHNDWRPRLTWLGLLTLLAYALYLSESYARFKYCHPLYARTMVGYGVDIDAPRPPFVLAKVIYRHTALGTLLAPFYHVTKIIIKILASLVGYLVGFIFGDGGSGGGVVRKGKGTGNRQPPSRDVRIPQPNWGPDLSLMDDEFL